MIEIDREIYGAYDFELGRKRTAGLQYSITWPQEGEAAGVVFVIAGFGADTNSDYTRALRRHIVETTGMGAVSVRYHAFCARPDNGGEPALLDKTDALVRLAGISTLYGGTVTADMSLDALIDDVAERAPGSLMAGVINPPDDEYQNFGVIQALDHLEVIGDLIEYAPPFDTRRIVVLGSSHGGYIGHLMAKIAPSTLAAVIDNSSYVQPPMSYLGFGGTPELSRPWRGLTLQAHVRSPWTLAFRHDANFYDRDRDLIRDLHYLPHARTSRAASSDAGTQFFMVSSSQDRLTLPQTKRRQQQVLSNAGFDAHLQLVEQKDVDGALFKSVEHGMDCSLKRLFDREIAKVRPRETEPDAKLGTVVAYDGLDKGYRFTHSAVAPYVTGETYEMYPLADGQKEGRSSERAA